MSQNTPLYFDDYHFDPVSKELFLNDQPHGLQPLQAELLALLITHAPNMVTREKIQTTLWPKQVLEFDKSINFCIKGLRQVLKDDPKNPKYIQTVPRRGYRFVAAVQKSAANSTPNLPNRTRKILFSLCAVFLVTAVFALITIQKSHQDNSYIYASLPTDYQRAQFMFNKPDYHSRRRSREVLARALEHSPNHPIVLAYTSSVYSLTADNPEDFSQARHYLERARLSHEALSINSAELALAEGVYALYFEWHIPRALKFLEQASKSQADWPLVWHELAVAQAVAGETQNAAFSIEHLLKLNPGSAQERHHAGWFYLINQDWETALNQCQAAIEIDPANHSSLICAAQAAEKLQRLDLARRYYSKVVEDLADSAVKESVLAQIEEHNFHAFYYWLQDIYKSYQAGAFQFALCYASVGDKASTLAFLEKSRQQHERLFPLALAFHEFQPWRNSVEFKELMEGVILKDLNL